MAQLPPPAARQGLCPHRPALREWLSDNFPSGRAPAQEDVCQGIGCAGHDIANEGAQRIDGDLGEAPNDPPPQDTIGPFVREHMMLSYVYFGTNDLERATRFYDATLAPLGMPRCVTGDPEWDRVAAGWGIYENGGARLPVAQGGLFYGLS